jgi:hypothetical protein
MAAQGLYQRMPRQIDLGDGKWFTDNNIAKKDYDLVKAGFQGEAWTRKLYTAAYWTYQRGVEMREGLEKGWYEVQESGRIVKTLAYYQR